MTVERSEYPDELAERVIEFYIGCVEDEARGDTFVQLGSSDYVELEAGLSPVIGARCLPDNRAAARFRRECEVGYGDSLVGGWPLIVGTHSRERGEWGGRVLVASPLLMVDVRLVRSDGAWSVEPQGSDVEFNHYALELLDVDRSKCNCLARLVQESPEAREAGCAEDRADTILRILRDYGIAGLDCLDPQALVSQSRSAGIHNTGLIFAPTKSKRNTSVLLTDLQEMLENPALLTSGTAGSMLALRPNRPPRFRCITPPYCPQPWRRIRPYPR